MPRKSSVAVLDTNGPERTPLDAIPQELKDYLEKVYEAQRKNPGRERVEYDTEDELKAEFKLMADYLAQRPAGVLSIRKSPTRGRPDTEMDFRINANLEENGKKNANNQKSSSAAK